MTANADNQAEILRLRSELEASQLMVQRLQQRIDKLERRVDAEQASAALFAAQVKELRKSRSWQMTLPVRAGMRAARKIRSLRG